MGKGQNSGLSLPEIHCNPSAPMSDRLMRDAQYVCSMKNELINGHRKLKKDKNKTINDESGDMEITSVLQESSFTA